MKFIVLVKGGEETEAGVLPTAEDLAPMGRFNDELIDAGVLLAMDGLAPTSKGARIRFDGHRHIVTDGPFPETKELIAGYWIVEVGSKEEAIAWFSRAPFTDGEIELRQIFGADDFGAALTPEMRAQDERIRARLAAKP